MNDFSYPQKEKKYLRPIFLTLGILISGAILIIAVIWASFEIFSLSYDLEDHVVKNKHLEEERKELEEKVVSLNEEIKILKEANESLRNDLERERDDVDKLIDRLEEVTGEVEKIRTLEDIDRELLKKYSKVYFLNENYEPSGLTEIPEEFLAPTREEGYFHEDAWPILKEMMEDAEWEGIELEIVSGYRSFDEQSELKEKYSMIYGEGTANLFSAEQGYSEHQLGTAVDFSTGEMEGALSGFENTEAYTWLKENAYKYGFILSYPQGNEYFQYEPWHWRFVGIKLATELHERGKYFYDMDQREIDEYRLYLFDF